MPMTIFICTTYTTTNLQLFAPPCRPQVPTDLEYESCTLSFFQQPSRCTVPPIPFPRTYIRTGTHMTYIHASEPIYKAVISLIIRKIILLSFPATCQRQSSCPVSQPHLLDQYSRGEYAVPMHLCRLKGRTVSHSAGWDSLECSVYVSNILPAAGPPTPQRVIETFSSFWGFIFSLILIRPDYFPMNKLAIISNFSHFHCTGYRITWSVGWDLSEPSYGSVCSFPHRQNGKQKQGARYRQAAAAAAAEEQLARAARS